MSLTLETIPCLADNYAFLLHDEVSGGTALFDAPEAFPILRVLEEKGWQLTEIYITHHHGDHIDAVAELVEATGARVTGAARDAHRLPPLDRAVEPGDKVQCNAHTLEVIDASGHTTGHIAYFCPEAEAAFTGDSLMALGCGRLFEGTPDMMWATLSRLAALPAETLICSGHEYTASNGKFAQSVDPDNPELAARIRATAEARALNEPTVPSLLALEKATNPFLRASDPALKAAHGMAEAPDATVFAHLRKAKDNF